MNSFHIKKGLDIPISGSPEQEIRDGGIVTRVALVGDDYVGMKPTMLVSVGDHVLTGQPVFTDKKNPGVTFVAPGTGLVLAINRGPKRKFESIVIGLDGDDAVQHCDPVDDPASLPPDAIRKLLIDSGMWVSFRTRPFGKTPAIKATPASLFITATESEPLSPHPQTIISEYRDEFRRGLETLVQLLDCPIHYCTAENELLSCEKVDGINYHRFTGPHPSGLASTHIHMIDPVHEEKTVWQIGYQDVISIGYLLKTGQTMTERVVAIAGSGSLRPTLLRTRVGASLIELCRRQVSLDTLRIISGSVLSGRESKGDVTFLGRYHNQISVILDSSGRSIFNWLLPGTKRFSIRPVFAAAFMKPQRFPMNTALWGGRRAIYPLGTYDEVMPLDIIATSLLKSLAAQDTEKSKALGCLELIEEDLGLCGFVCPGKNEFGDDLRAVLTEIEQGG